MRIGFLCSEARMNYIKHVIDSYFSDIDPIYMIDDLYYFSYETEKKLNVVKDEVNGFIFGGELQFHYYNKIFQPQIPCGYLSKDWSTLQNAMLAIGRVGIDFSSVSIDSYSITTVKNILEDAGFSFEDSKVKVIERRNFGKPYIDYVVRKHREFYETGIVSGCITALAPVYKSLSETNIPCVYAHPTLEIISKTIDKIRDKYEHQKGQSASYAIILIQLIPKKEYSTIRKDEYLYMHEKIKVAEEIYYFAKETNAAILSDSFDKFVILMNRSDLVEYTNGMQNFYLINKINNETHFDILLGIGYGYTPGQAKFNANLAIEKFDCNTVNMVYVVMDTNSILGPLNFLADHPKEKLCSEELSFIEMSKISGVSKALLWNIYSLIEKNKKNTYTASELSKKLNLSQRSTSRLLRKLEESGLATIVNKEVKGTSGRPSDIYEISIVTHD